MSADGWRQIHEDLDTELSAYQKEFTRHQQEHEQAIRSSLASLSVLAEALAQPGDEHEVRFRGLSRKLRRLASGRDSRVLCQKLQHEIVNLERYAERVQKADSRTMERLSQAVNPTPGWKETLDPLTGLPDALEAQAAYRRKVGTGTGFCVIHLRIESLGSFAERGGIQATAGVITQFARRLRDQLEESTPAYRWQAGEFIVFSPGKAWSQAERWTGVQAKLSGIYHVRVGAAHVQFPVYCVARVMEHAEGESLEESVTRGEQSVLQRIHEAPPSQEDPVCSERC